MSSAPRVTWNRLCADRRAEPHEATSQEFLALRGVIERNLADASLAGLSADNRFGLGYEAALLIAKMAIACAGYRVKGPEAHATTFQALALAMGPAVSKEVAYFDRCRRKRNVLSYEFAGAASESEAAEILRRARRLWEGVEAWIARRRPDLAR